MLFEVLEFVLREGQAAWLEGAEPVKVQRRNNGRPTGIALVRAAPPERPKAYA